MNPINEPSKIAHDLVTKDVYYKEKGSNSSELKFETP